MAVATGIEHFAIAAKDTRALTDFYANVLGFAVVFTNSQTPATFFVRPARGGCMIEIMPANNAPARRPERFDPGLAHVALSVSDLAATRRELAARGIAFETDVLVTGETKAIFFRDPEGNLLHLIERPMPL